MSPIAPQAPILVNDSERLCPQRSCQILFIKNDEGSDLQIDVIIPTRDRSELLTRCLASLNSAVAPTTVSLRVLLCINGNDEDTVGVTRRMQRDLVNLRIDYLFEPNRLSAAAARNRLLPAAQAEWIFFVDDDAYVDPQFFDIFLDLLKQNPAAEVIGGPNLTPKNSSSFQLACGAAMASRFGASLCSARYAPRIPPTRHCGEEPLILCNLFVRKSALGKLRFPETLVCNEENWVLQDLIHRGSQLVYDPKLFLWHERRPTIEQFMLQIHRYGIGRGQNLRLRPYTARLSYLMPALAITFTFLAFAGVFLWPILLQIWLVLFCSYGLIWLLAALRLRWRESGSLRICLTSALLFPIIHISYGLGVLRGLATSHA